jgi:hypothetical protein
MTVGATDGLWRITPESSSNFLDLLDNKLVVLQCMYLGHKGECQKISAKILTLEKLNWHHTDATAHRVHTIWLR